ncbi:hypothetical protein SUGI_0414690 [Cryptomeria japonica]|nr:hypothetical protein SUGI_0414690 [Cryptomeria japonica]
METKCGSKRSSGRTSRVSSRDGDKAGDEDGIGGDYFLLPILLGASVFFLVVLVSYPTMVSGVVRCRWSMTETSVRWDLIVLQIAK